MKSVNACQQRTGHAVHAKAFPSVIEPPLSDYYQRHSLSIASIASISPFFFFFLNDRAPPEIYPLPLHDALPISRIKFVCTAFRRKNHRRFEGTNGTGGPVRREVQIGKCLGFSREKLGRNSLCARQHRPPVRSEMALHQPHFLARFRKRRKIRARPERVTH